MKQHLLILLSLPFLVVSSCNSSAEEKSPKSEKTMELKEDSLIPKEAKPILKDTTFFLVRNSDSISVKIMVPKEVKGAILILHGWNLPVDDLCNKTSLCQKAMDSGLVCILPNFGKSTYQWENYPQTIKRFLKYPTRKWMTDTFLVHLQKEFGLLEKGNRNFVYGVSTGGRGAALLTLENPEIFKAAACLSADFDHAQLVNEPINNGYYGPLKKFPERWTGRDNIHNRAAEFTSGLYLSHGVKDQVCPVSQTINFDLQVRKVNPDLRINTEIDSTGAHDYPFWESKTNSVLSFFLNF